MKKLTILFMVMIIAIGANAQHFTAPANSSASVKVDSTTTFTYSFNNDSKKYNVYRSKSGAYYVWKVSKKTGKSYRYYLPKEVQTKMGRKYEK